MRRFFPVLSSLATLWLAAAPVAAVAADDPAEVSDFSGLDFDALLNPRVVSASQQVEPLSETPVPVTVVTSEMIRAIGARNLQDILLTWVPGMTLVADHNEMNVAMHGVYASSQQKILVLVDGHRLNSRAYAMANPDFGINVDWTKVKQIEVLRGPGSSLYGNIALTAVINIVTVDGGEIEGATVRLGAGNYGQRGLNLAYGKRFGEKSDLVIWGALFRADGEVRTIPAERDYAAVPSEHEAILGGVKKPASYDVGLRHRQGPLTLFGDLRFGKVVEPFTSAGAVTGEGYTYENVRTLGTNGPGLGSRSYHVEAKYAEPLGAGIEVEATGYYDKNDLEAVLVSDPVLQKAIYLTWNDDAAGAVLLGRYSYDLGAFSRGNLSVGAQVDRMRLIDSALPSMTGGDWTGFADTKATRVLARGSETIYSAFAQLKHHLGDTLLLNLGARYDDKDRFMGPNVRAVSPRLALVYAPFEALDVKLSYAESFVDAPYWYRYNSLASYRGARDLTPEHLRSLQLTPTVTLLGGLVRNTLNLYYNHLYDFVFRNNAALPSEPIYQNAGKLTSVGAEEEISLTLSRLHVSANATYQYALDANASFGARGGDVYNVPRLVGNLVVQVAPLPSIADDLWVTASVRYIGEQHSPIAITFKDGAGNVVNSYNDPDHTVAAHALVNLGVRSSLGFVGMRDVAVDATAYNLLDERYQQGGSTVHPYPQPGRWFLINVTGHLPL
ncbi:MAG: TonB-dependent receptor [Myxococcota bacterium]